MEANCGGLNQSPESTCASLTTEGALAAGGEQIRSGRRGPRSALVLSKVSLELPALRPQPRGDMAEGTVCGPPEASPEPDPGAPSHWHRSLRTQEGEGSDVSAALSVRGAWDDPAASTWRPLQQLLTGH